MTKPQTPMNPPTVILASASPRRQQFLRCLDIPFAIETADIDETPAAAEPPDALVERLAIAKAMTVGERLSGADAGRGDYESKGRPTAEGLNSDCRRVATTELLVIAADTVVALDGDVLGKPAHAEEAFQMLLRLRARPHQVHSALAVARFVGGRCQLLRSLVNTTTVKMRRYSESEIADYVATGDPLDKAGAYAIQHQRFSPVESLSGCPAAVMGLPAAELERLLTEFNCPAAQRPMQFCHSLTGFPCCQEIQKAA